MEWDWFISTDRLLLFHWNLDGIWRQYSRQRNIHYNYSIECLIVPIAPTGELLRATIKLCHYFIEVKNTVSQIIIEIHSDSLIKFGAIDLSVPEVNWFNTDLESSNTASLLMKCLIDGTAVGVSDGSYFHLQEVGACACLFDTPDGTEWFEGGGVIPGLSSDQNSYMSKLGGQLGIASFVSQVNLPIGFYVLTAVCDGLSALKRVEIERRDIRCSSKHVDMLSIITELWDES